MAFSSRGRPNVSRLARRGKVDDLRAALQYTEATDAGSAPDPAVTVRVEAAEALAGFEGPAVAGDLAAALGDPAPEVRLAAIGSLETVGVHDSDQVDRLIECVVARGERAPELTSRALKLLVASVPRGSVDLLADRLLDPDSPPPDEGHRASLDLLLTTDDRGSAARESVVDTLVWRLENRADDPAENRAEVLLRWLGDTARDKVLHALENGTASPAVMQAAGRLGDARAVGPVVAGLQDTDAEMRAAAAHAAKALNHTRAVPALLQATQDDEQAVRDAASAALDRMGTAAVIAGLAAVVDARGLLEGGADQDLNAEALDGQVAQALGEGSGDGEAPEAAPASAAETAAVTPPAAPAPAGPEAPAGPDTPAPAQSTQLSAYPPRQPRRGGLLDRLFGTRDY